MGRFGGLFGKKKDKESSDRKVEKPKFVRKEQKGNSTYEIYRGKDAETARAFLLKKRVDVQLYYIVVETPEGAWGMDVKGLYLEHLLPWQTKISSAECAGHIIPMSFDMFGLQMAARRYNDNFIAKVQCGKCEHQWPDGVRYQDLTVVRCPKCKAYNKVDSSSIHCVFT